MDLLVGNNNNSSTNSASLVVVEETGVDAVAVVAAVIVVAAPAGAKEEEGVATMEIAPPANCVARRATRFFAATRGSMPHSPAPPTPSLHPPQRQTTASTPTGIWTPAPPITSLESLTS
jgi:hypothetical protein